MLNADLFKENIRVNQLFAANDNLLLAVSGGVDSVVLCELCAQSGFRFEIAHANFSLRGEESKKDEQLVRDIAEKYQVPIHVKVFNTQEYIESTRVSLQVAARELRYAWFEQLIEKQKSWLLTAHHSGDNIETLLMNFFRGTGIKGLHGILPKQNRLIRPLLPFTKEEIIAFATEHQLNWREDQSNSSDKYTRNYFRNTIIPMVAKVYPEVEKNLAENIARFSEAEQLYEQSISNYKKSLVEIKGKEFYIPVLKLKASKPLATIVHEIIRDYGFTASQVNDVIHLLDAAQSKFVQSPTHRIIRNRNWLIIASNQSDNTGHLIIEEGVTEIKIENGRLTLQMVKASEIQLNSSPSIAFIDARELTYPLVLRKWKAGDYFYPLGMTKKKKVSRFLIDQKLSVTQKEKIMVLESGKRICWLAGLRIDNRFRVKDSTENVLRVELKA